MRFDLHRFLHPALTVIAALAWGPATAATAQVSSHATVAVSIRVEPIAEVSFPQGTHFVIVVPHPECRQDSGDGDHSNDHSNGQSGDHSGDHADSQSGDQSGGDHSGDSHDGDHSGDHGCVQWTPPIVPVRIPFVVTGNALAVVSARPDAFLRIWSGRYLGKAVQPAHGALGYHLILHFPAPDAFYHWQFGWNGGDNWNGWNNWNGYGHLPPWSQIAQLPGTDGAGTPPLTANLVSRGGTAYGVIYLVAENDWTAHGDDADPGNYYGSIDVTVTATQQR